MRLKGARNFALVRLGSIGCAPGVIAATNSSTGCIEEMNTAASIFNEKMRVMVDKLNSDFCADSKFIIINTTAILSNPAFLGIIN